MCPLLLWLKEGKGFKRSSIRARKLQQDGLSLTMPDSCQGIRDVHTKSAISGEGNSQKRKHQKARNLTFPSLQLNPMLLNQAPNTMSLTWSGSVSGSAN